ncbi:hypothetical protein CF319_g3320 [Tilletia indica]|nr:hypothetical protein CF319_g3320 [Tilletia indica]KAE8229446.1 hypothetical protein CF326_g5585 [Tilletia indica]
MSSNDEQTFTIQPHPAQTNDPSDPANSGSGSAPTAAQAAAAAVSANNPGPALPANASNLEEPASKEELAARSAELNK